MSQDGAKMSQDGAKMEPRWSQDGAKMSQDEPRWKKKEQGRKRRRKKGTEGSKNQEERREQNKEDLYTLTPDHPALLAPYYIMYNLRELCSANERQSELDIRY